MNEQREFRPQLCGVVGKDLALSREAAHLFCELCASVGARMEESVTLPSCESEARERLFSIGREGLEEARLLGELAVALGARGRARRCASAEEVLRRARKETRRRIEIYETMMGCTADRVVRSVLSRLILMARRSSASD